MLDEDIKQVPNLFMRSLIIASQANPTIKTFSYTTLIPKCVDVKIWLDKNLWKGFKILIQKFVATEGAIPALLSLPVEKLNDVLITTPNAKEPLSIYLSDLPNKNQYSEEIRSVLGFE